MIGGILDLDPERWLYPKQLEPRLLAENVAAFTKLYDPFDWTKMIGGEE